MRTTQRQHKKGKIKKTDKRWRVVGGRWLGEGGKREREREREKGEASSRVSKCRSPSGTPPSQPAMKRWWWWAETVKPIFCLNSASCLVLSWLLSLCLYFLLVGVFCGFASSLIFFVLPLLSCRWFVTILSLSCLLVFLHLVFSSFILLPTFSYY